LTELHWTKEVGDGESRVAVGETRIVGIGMTDAMVFDLGSDGRIQRISPHLRPWLALTLFALVLGPKVARHPASAGGQSLILRGEPPCRRDRRR
jgi:hypothetical protein